MTYDSWKAREPEPFFEGEGQDEPIVETRVPTEQDVAFAQAGFEYADACWNDALHLVYGAAFYQHRFTAMARGRLGSELRRASDAREIAHDHYRSVWNDYLGGVRREFP